MNGAQPARPIRPTKEQGQAAAPDQSIWVSANAGSGKTHVLVERVIRLLLAGANPAAILCITYTKAAAAEMADRLFRRLSAWTGLSEEVLTEALNAIGVDGDDERLRVKARRLFTLALETPGGLKIQTIHAFCERLLHLFPVESGIAPGFRVLDERGSKELQERSTQAVLAEAETGSNDLNAAFQRLAERFSREQFDHLVRAFVTALKKRDAALPHFDMPTYELALKIGLGLPGELTYEQVAAEFETIDAAGYRHHAGRLRPFGTFGGVDVASELEGIGRLPGRADALIRFYLKKTDFEPRANLISAQARAAEPQTENFLKTEQSRIKDLLRARNTLQAIAASVDACRLAFAILERIEREKTATANYEFADLISRTASLLLTRSARNWVLYKLDSGISHILLDEAQDTGAEQWQIIEALTEEFFSGQGREYDVERTLFVVGDQKQSIYSFQGADTVAYDAARQKLTLRHEERKRLTVVNLSVSYRSTPEILRAVDAVFDREMLLQAGIKSVIDVVEQPHVASRTNDSGVVEIWPALEADDKEEEDPWTKPVDRPPQSSPPRKLAHDIAARIQSWLDPRRPRWLRGQNRPVCADDILILFRSRGPLFHMLLAQLRQAGIPVSGADRLNLLQSLIVQDLLMLLQWLLLPQDDHALAVTLKSPLVPEPFTENELFDLAYYRGEEPMFSRLAGKNAAFLQSLQKARLQGTPFTLLSDILNGSRKAILARLGPEAIEASDAFLDLALEHERQDGASLFAFVQWVTATETTIRREFEKDAGEVRLMTVHGAKGLEAPIVILADAMALGGGPQNMPNVFHIPAGEAGGGLPVLWPSGMRPVFDELRGWEEDAEARAAAENRRLLYVAMTRAADELYVAGYHRKKTSGEATWWDMLTAKFGTPAETPLRVFGKPDEFGPSKLSEPKASEAVPAWLETPVEMERVSQASAVSATLHGVKRYDPAVARRGRMVHRLLEELADTDPSARRDLAEMWSTRHNMNAAEALDLAKALQHPDLAPFLGPDSRGEVEVAGILPDGRTVSGRIDRLTVAGNGIWILDYKTDRTVPDILPQDHDYARQLARYAALLKLAYPGLPVTAALFWTTILKLEILSETVLTAALQKGDDARP